MTQRPPPDEEKPALLTNFLWFCAGADSRLLRRCPNSDQVKYQGIGGIVLATAVLAFASGSYAFYTVFSPKDETALNTDVHTPSVVVALILGVLWAAVIFNIDRFIVSSTGKGDGTEAITLGELGKGIPRIIMAVIIGVCISAPLEIRILKPEIDAQLELEQNEYLAKLNAQSEKMIDGRKAELRARMDGAQKRLDDRTDYFEKRRMEIKEQRRLLELEAEGKTGSGHAGRGPAWKDKKETLDKMEEELDKDRANDTERNKSVEAEMGTWKAELAQLDEKLAAAKASNLKQARHLDGLMKRIHISHDIGGSIPFWIMLLLLAIETGPIFFKMMLVRGAYDYVEENEKRLATARLGVETEAHVHTGNGNKEIRVDVFHQVEAVLAEERMRLKSETDLAQRVHTRFVDEAGKEIAQGDGYKKFLKSV